MKRQVTFIDTELEQFGRRMLRRLNTLQELIISTIPSLLPPDSPRVPDSPILIDLTLEDEEPETHLLYDDDEDNESVILFEIHPLIVVEVDDDSTDSEAGETTEEEDGNEVEHSDSDRSEESEGSFEEGSWEDDLQFILEDV